MSFKHEDSEHRSIEILEDLVRIQSVNPHYGDGAKGEKEVAEYIERRMRKAGLVVTRQNVFPDRYNLIVELRVGKPQSTLLLEAHMDTVSLGSMPDPLTPKREAGRLYGRGACDTKGSLAGMIYAMEECAKHPERLHSDLMLCASVDEEHAYRGLLSFLELDVPIHGAVVGEPTELGIVVAHKGCARFSVRTHGKAAHSSMPHEGNNAIYQMMRVLQYIREHVEPELLHRLHPLCGSPTISVGTITGGKQVNIVPEFCEIEVDRRIIPGELPEQVLFNFEQGLRNYTAETGTTITIQQLLLDWALHTPLDSLVVEEARQVARRLQLNDTLCGVPYGSNASKLQQLGGIPAIVFGPGSIAQAHSRNEWVDVKSVEQAAEFYLNLATAFKVKESG